MRNAALHTIGQQYWTKSFNLVFCYWLCILKGFYYAIRTHLRHKIAHVHAQNVFGIHWIKKITTLYDSFISFIYGHFRYMQWMQIYVIGVLKHYTSDLYPHHFCWTLHLSPHGKKCWHIAFKYCNSSLTW